MIHSFPTAAYIHLPFCRRRCYYCDFAISVVGDAPLKDDSLMVRDYVESICQEIKLTAIKNEPLQTIFFGGGTPSLLPVKHLETILTTIEKYLAIAPNVEISLEIDPGTFDLERLREYLLLGINRVSLGVQTFDAQLLQFCGRTHNVKDIFMAIDLIKQANLKNFSLDLITGLPHQTIKQCQDSLITAISIAPSHLSCYDLVLEPVTAFGKQYRPGKTPLPTDEISTQMYQLTQQMLTSNGYQHYEISNYAQIGFQCRHNRIYWENQPYYGFGMSAASYVNGKRFNRPRTRQTYYDWVRQGAIINTPKVTENDYLLETLMLGLRLAEGVDLSFITQSFGEQTKASILDCLKPYLKQNLVTIDSRTGINKLQLTDPEGFLLSNTILATLFEKLEIND
jgi:putative oxygen-independent coproporphyrinogen III oxidase